MTQANEGQATAPNDQDTSLSANLDVAAFAATQSKATEPAKPAEGAPAAAGAEGADKAAAEAAAQAEGDDKPFRTFSNMKPDEIEKLLTADPGTAPAADGEGKTPPADLDKAAAEAATLLGAEGDEGKKIPTVPLPRLNQEVDKRRSAETVASDLEKKNLDLQEQLNKANQETAYLKGVAEGRKGMEPAKTGTKPDPVAEVQADLARLAADKEAVIAQAASDFDNGKLTMKDYEAKKATITRNAVKIENTLTARLGTLQAERNAPDPATAEQVILADPRLETATNELIAKNPWMNQLTESAMAVVHGMALQEMERQGIPNVANAESTWQLRRLIAQCGKTLGYDRLQVPAAPAPGTKPAEPTAEQRAAKLDLAGKHPAGPTLGGTALPNDAIAGLDIDKASVADLSKLLPKSSMEKMLGLTPP